VPSYSPTTDAGRDALKALAANPAETLLALDFDGTLAPIVDEPSHALVHPRSVAALSRLGTRLGQIAVITGRPVETALRLGGFTGKTGLEHMVILGQYGVERWDAATGEIKLPPLPAAIADLAGSLPAWLAKRDAAWVRIEDKGRALVLHTRGLPDADGRIDGLLQSVTELAGSRGLVAEPGRQVIEIRSGTSDKGIALRGIVEETGVRNILYAGDDLGDLPAFNEVEVLRGEGLTALLACSASVEQDALLAHSDLVLNGPDAVADWLEALADGL